MKKWFALSLVVILSLLTVLTGCNTGDRETNTTESKLLRVATEYEDWVMRGWLNYYWALHPELEIEVVELNDILYRNWNRSDSEQNDPIADVNKVLEENPVDLIVLRDQGMMQTFIDQGMLQPLDSFLRQGDQISLDDLVPGVKDRLQEMGGGSIYTMAPTFSTYVLAYNKEMFDRFNQPYPHDQMTWDELLTLSEAFYEGEGLDATFGLSLGRKYEIFDYLTLYGAQSGLQLVDLETMTANVNSPDWKAAWEFFAEAYENHLIAHHFEYWEYIEAGYDEDHIPWSRSPFHGGKAAMGIISSQDLYYLQDQMRYDPDEAQFSFDIAAFPSPASNPNMGAPIQLESLFAIPQNANNAELAWDAIGFSLSKKLLDIQEHTRDGFSSIQEYMIPASFELNHGAFTTKTEAPYMGPLFDYRNMSYNPQLEQAMEVVWRGQDYFIQVLEEKLTVDEALVAYQENAEQILASIETREEELIQEEPIQEE